MTEAEFNQGGLLAASHILFGFPGGAQEAPSDAVRDSVRRRAEEVRAQVTTANFAEMARRHGSDGTAQTGGSLGIFPPQQMIPEFSRAVTALQPGDISQPVLTQYGYHIIRRTPFAEVDQQQLAGLATQLKAFKAESTYRATLERAQRVAIRPNVAKTVKAVGEDPDAHRDDETVLATHAKGEFTAGRLAQYVMASPPQQQLRQQIAAMPDSITPRVVEQFVFLDLVLAQADSAKVQVDTAQAREIEQAFVSAVTSAWTGLGISPSQLADSAQTEDAKASLAAQRVERYFESLVKGEAPFVQIPAPVEAALKDKYRYKVNDAGVERALEMATRVRAKADSARAMQQPPSAVPMPGAPQGAPQGPPPAQPQGTMPTPPPAGR
jgi:hypothetical protein